MTKIDLGVRSRRGRAFNNQEIGFPGAEELWGDPGGSGEAPPLPGLTWAQETSWKVDAVSFVSNQCCLAVLLASP